MMYLFFGLFAGGMIGWMAGYLYGYKKAFNFVCDLIEERHDGLQKFRKEDH